MTRRAVALMGGSLAATGGGLVVLDTMAGTAAQVSAGVAVAAGLAGVAHGAIGHAADQPPAGRPRRVRR